MKPIVRTSIPVLAALLFFTTLFTVPTVTRAQQPAAPASASAARPVIEEWVYRTRYGFKDEWWAIFQKYQVAILERQKQLGYVTDFTVYAPSLHTSEDARWD